MKAASLTLRRRPSRLPTIAETELLDDYRRLMAAKARPSRRRGYHVCAVLLPVHEIDTLEDLQQLIRLRIRLISDVLEGRDRPGDADRILDAELFTALRELVRDLRRGRAREHGAHVAGWRSSAGADARRTGMMSEKKDDKVFYKVPPSRGLIWPTDADNYPPQVSYNVPGDDPEKKRRVKPPAEGPTEPPTRGAPR